MALAKTALEPTTAAQLARPLATLVPLIQEDLKRGREAAERAGVPYYLAAGEKMLEAKPQIAHGNFKGWIKRHFSISYETAGRYMRFAADQKVSAIPFSSISDHVRQTSNPNYNRAATWHFALVKEVLERVDTETLNLKRDELKRADEREAQRALALQLIDIGYKVLARELHPDKGGSREAMARLNAVRDRLKQCC